MFLIFILFLTLNHARVQFCEETEGNIGILHQAWFEPDQTEVQGEVVRDQCLLETARRDGQSFEEGQSCGRRVEQEAQASMHCKREERTEETTSWKEAGFCAQTTVYLYGRADFGMVQTPTEGEVHFDAKDGESVRENCLSSGPGSGVAESGLLVSELPGTERDCVAKSDRASPEEIYTREGKTRLVISHIDFELQKVRVQYYGFLRKVKLKHKFRACMIANLDEIPT